MEALLLARGFADRQSIIFALSLLAWQASASGDVDRAGRIWGGVEAEVARAGPVGQWDLEQDEFRDLLVIDGDPFREAFAVGRSLSLEEVVELALSGD